MLPDPGDDAFVTPSGGRLGAGSHRQAFDRAVELGDKAWQAARDAHAGDPRVRVGIGFASFVEPTGPSYYGTTGHWRSYDSALVRIEPDGSALVGIGVQAIGQGIQSTTAAIAADALGLDLDDVSVVTGDTDLCPYGLGAWGGRGAIVTQRFGAEGGRARGHQGEGDRRRPAGGEPGGRGHLQGRLHVRGSDEPSVTWRDVATAAYARTNELPEGVEPGLEATVTYEPPGIDSDPDEHGRMNVAAAWSNASHAAVVKVDITTGAVEVLDYVVVHDCGTVINPLIVEGQTTGGVAQGVAGALYEHIVYDENGQPLSASFMDYTVPSSLEIPPITIEHLETPSATTPLGVKGVGESGTIGPAAAIANAVADALAEFDVDIVETPITPTSVLQAIHAFGRRVVKPPAFRYLRPGSLEEVVAALAEHGDEAKPLAGGQSLIPAMNFRLAQPSVLVDLELVEALRTVRRCGRRAARRSDGSSTGRRALAEVRGVCPLLSEALPWIGHPQNRNRGTIGGSIVHADPAAELPAVAVALEATVELLGSRGARTVPATTFFEGPFTTAVEPDEVVDRQCGSPPPWGSGPPAWSWRRGGATSRWSASPPSCASPTGGTVGRRRRPRRVRCRRRHR